MISSSHHILSIDKIPATSHTKKQNVMLETGLQKMDGNTNKQKWSPEIGDTDRTYPSISRCTARDRDNIRHLFSTKMIVLSLTRSKR